jgi:phosphoglycerate dehydrogenase-like enzyme
MCIVQANHVLIAGRPALLMRPNLLVYRPTWLAQAEKFTALPPHDVVLMGPCGTLSSPTLDLANETVRLDAAWIDSRVWLSDASDRFWNIMEKAQDLQWVQSAGSGLDSPRLRGLMERGIAISRTDVQSVGIAEFVLCRVLALFQREPERHASQKAHRWEPLSFREISATRWLIIGFGAIGRDVAIRAQGFGADIVGMRRDQSPDPFADRIAHPGTLHAELADADVVILSVPLSPATENMFDEAAFAAMKPGAVLVNVGRGGLIDETALLAALDSGRLQHAILDVARQEPLPLASPLWTHPGIWMTGHGSAYGDGLPARAERFALANIRRFLEGQIPLNLVRGA